MTREYKGRPFGITGKARAITDEELNQAIEYCRARKHPERNVAMLILSNYLGLRAKEMASLKISDVYDGRGIVKTLRLIAAYTKGGKHRDLSLEHKRVVAVLEDLIQQRLRDDGNLFNMSAPLFRSQTGSKFGPNSIAHRFMIIYRGAGLEKASSHSGRRSLLTKLAYNGVDLNTVRQIAGHKHLSTTQMYLDDSPQRVRDVLTSI